jgi:hypothetical protein
MLGFIYSFTNKSNHLPWPKNAKWSTNAGNKSFANRAPYTQANPSAGSTGRHDTDNGNDSESNDNRDNTKGPRSSKVYTFFSMSFGLC